MRSYQVLARSIAAHEAAGGTVFNESTVDVPLSPAQTPESLLALHNPTAPGASLFPFKNTQASMREFFEGGILSRRKADRALLRRGGAGAAAAPLAPVAAAAGRGAPAAAALRAPVAVPGARAAAPLPVPAAAAAAPPRAPAAVAAAPPRAPAAAAAAPPRARAGAAARRAPAAAPVRDMSADEESSDDEAEEQVPEIPVDLTGKRKRGP